MADSLNSSAFLVINSADRNNVLDPTSDFKIDLPYKLQGIYQMFNIIFPNSMYNVDSTNSTIYFNDGTANRTCNLPEGFYSTSDITAAIKTAMEGVSTTTFTVTLDSATQKLSIAGSTPFSLTFGTHTTNSIASTIGYKNVDTNTASSHVADYIIDLSYPRMLLFTINGRKNVVTTKGIDATMAVAINANSTEFITEYVVKDFAMQVQLDNDTTLAVSVADEYGDTLDLNGANWQMILKRVAGW
jgi:hypothetical protein